MAVCAKNEDFQGIGCDVEKEARKIPANSDHHFMNTQDKCSYTALERWCIKEACFKALSNANIKIKLLKEVLINDDSFGKIDELQLHPSRQFKLIRKNGYIIVVAFWQKTLTKSEIMEIPE